MTNVYHVSTPARWSLNPMQSAMNQLWKDQGLDMAKADIHPGTMAWCYPPRWIYWLAKGALGLWKMLKR